MRVSVCEKGDGELKMVEAWPLNDHTHYLQMQEEEKMDTTSTKSETATLLHGDIGALLLDAASVGNLRYVQALLDDGEDGSLCDVQALLDACSPPQPSPHIHT